MNGGLGLIAARALLYAGTLVAFGLPAYLALTTKTVRRQLEAQHRPWRYVAVAAGAAIAGTLIHLLLLTAAMHGVAAGEVDQELLGFVCHEMPVGHAALYRLVALALVLLAALGLRGWSRISACAILGAVALGSLAWNGHAMMNDGAMDWTHAAAMESLAWHGHAMVNGGAIGWTHLVADQVHLLAAGIWIGALVALLALTRATGEPGIAVRQEAFAGFSLIGTIVVATLVLTGIINSLMILVVPGEGPPAANYILLLALKLALFCCALALAANNRFRLTPALSQVGVAARLRRSVVVELTFIVATVLTVAVLGLLSPTG